MIKKILAAIGVGIAGIVMIVLGFGEFRETRKLETTGIKTTGEVAGFEEKSGRKGRTKYYLTVNFKTESGQSVAATSKVTSGVYSDAVHSKKVPVVYLPADPSVCRFSPEVKKDFTGIGVGAFLLGCSVVTGLRRNCVG